ALRGQRSNGERRSECVEIYIDWEQCPEALQYSSSPSTLHPAPSTAPHWIALEESRSKLELQYLRSRTLQQDRDQCWEHTVRHFQASHLNEPTHTIIEMRAGQTLAVFQGGNAAFKAFARNGMQLMPHMHCLSLTYPASVTRGGVHTRAWAVGSLTGSSWCLDTPTGGGLALTMQGTCGCHLTGGGNARGDDRKQPILSEHIRPAVHHDADLRGVCCSDLYKIAAVAGRSLTTLLKTKAVSDLASSSSPTGLRAVPHTLGTREQRMVSVSFPSCSKAPPAPAPSPQPPPPMYTPEPGVNERQAQTDGQCMYKVRGVSQSVSPPFGQRNCPEMDSCAQGRAYRKSRQAGLWVATATLTRGDSSSALGATTSSAVETAEIVRQARTEARFAVLGGGGEMEEEEEKRWRRGRGGQGASWWCGCAIQGPRACSSPRPPPSLPSPPPTNPQPPTTSSTSSGRQFNFCHLGEASESVLRWREDVTGRSAVMGVSAEAWSSLLWPGVTAPLPDHPPLTPSLLPGSPRETWRVMGTGTAGATLAGAFAGGLRGLLVSRYGPVRLTKQGPVKLSRGRISEICIQTHRGEMVAGRSEENQEEETTGANVDAKRLVKGQSRHRQTATIPRDLNAVRVTSPLETRWLPALQANPLRDVPALSLHDTVSVLKSGSSWSFTGSFAGVGRLLFWASILKKMLNRGSSATRCGTAHMFTGEASPEATEGNSPLKATMHSTTEALTAVYALMRRSFGVEETLSTGAVDVGALAALWYFWEICCS
ncbi:unnamed protein product, partial [Pleuronectes platessa]